VANLAPLPRASGAWTTTTTTTLGTFATPVSVLRRIRVPLDEFPASIESERRAACVWRTANPTGRLRQLFAKLERFSVDINVPGAEAPIQLETGFFARQAGGAVAVRSGDTVVYCTACSDAELSPNIDFVPLRVDYVEKFSAVGRTSAGYLKRERPGDREIQVSRLIDRPLRPCIAEGFFKETQVLANVFSFDGTHQADTLAICGAGAALALSPVPMCARVAGVRIGMRQDGSFVVNPTEQQMRGECKYMDMVVAGTSSAVLMIEAGCLFASEQQIAEAIEVAQRAIAQICEGIERLEALVTAAHPERAPKDDADLRRVRDSLLEHTRKIARKVGLSQAIRIAEKKQREAALAEIREQVLEELLDAVTEQELETHGAADEEAFETLCRMAWKRVLSSEMRRLIVREKVRADGRKPHQVRPIDIVQTPLPCAHGSTLFTRGETQTLAVVTLGGQDSAQRSESLLGEHTAHFYLQYMFPPFAVGEVGRIGAPGRREIGHGMLAQRALEPVVPPREVFPYVIRVESNIMESNGSSSMASVCGGSLALMDAGVPVSAAVAGVAMGLILDQTTEEPDVSRQSPSYLILTDILGMEDALGDMDFKVAGTRTGITALQMDIKVEGITLGIIREALEQARDARIHMLDVMDAACSAPRSTVPSSVPKIKIINIDPKRIGDVIGPGGRVVRSIIEACGGEENITIDIEPDGVVSILGPETELLERAARMIRNITMDVEVSQVFEQARVTKVLPFGAYVELDPLTGKEGWLHISEIAWHHIDRIEDVLREDQVIAVKVLEVNARGQVRVSRKALLERPQPSDAAAGASANGTRANTSRNVTLSDAPGSGSSARPGRSPSSSSSAPRSAPNRPSSSSTSGNPAIKPTQPAPPEET
jgi:polyribonucleotide nucleotidyltransferase